MRIEKKLICKKMTCTKERSPHNYVYMYEVILEIYIN